MISHDVFMLCAGVLDLEFYALPSRFPEMMVSPRPPSPVLGEYCASRMIAPHDSKTNLSRSTSTNSVLHAEEALGRGPAVLPRVRTQVGKLSDRLPMRECPSALGSCARDALSCHASMSDLITAARASPPVPHDAAPFGEAELDARIHLSRQTVQFVQRKVASHAHLSHGRLGVWELLAAVDARAAPGTLRLAALTSLAQVSPCTRTGQTMTWDGKRSSRRCRMSRITAPVGDVTTPMTEGR